MYKMLGLKDLYPTVQILKCFGFFPLLSPVLPNASCSKVEVTSQGRLNLGQ